MITEKRENYPDHLDHKEIELYLILDNIRSVYNVGSIFRTAETIGVNKILCLGTTPTPHDRFGNKRKDLSKVALGAEEMVAWEYYEKTKDLIKTLKKEKFKIIALEQDERAIDYREVKTDSEKVAIIVGNELGGVSKELLEIADIIAEIPMKGKKESLNVSVAVGVFLYSLLS